jgi:hypothetical protein
MYNNLNMFIYRIADNTLVINGKSIVKSGSKWYTEQGMHLSQDEWNAVLDYLNEEKSIAHNKAQEEVDNLLKEMGIQKFCKN